MRGAASGRGGFTGSVPAVHDAFTGVPESRIRQGGNMDLTTIILIGLFIGMVVMHLRPGGHGGHGSHGAGQPRSRGPHGGH